MARGNNPPNAGKQWIAERQVLGPRLARTSETISAVTTGSEFEEINTQWIYWNSYGTGSYKEVNVGIN